jgi:hypothetical protein
MKLSRTVVRLSTADRERLDGLRARCRKASLRPVSRAELVRLFVLRGLAGVDDVRLIADQLPPRAPVTPRAPRVRSPHEGALRVQSTESLRQRILKALAARPGEILGPRGVGALVGAAHPDNVRNALLALAQLGRIEKIGPGQYRGRCAPEDGALGGAP